MDSDSEDAIDEEAIELAMKRKAVKKQEAQQLREYSEKLEHTTLDSFLDKPEAVNTLRCVVAEPTFLVIEWDAPCANNSPITGYRVYLADEVLGETQPD